MCILSSENVSDLITICAELADELIIDLSCIYDTRVSKSFELAEKVLIVTESAKPAEVKLAQFMSQNNIFEGIKDKVIFVANKGAAIKEPLTASAVSLPLVQSNDITTIYKTLAENDWMM